MDALGLTNLIDSIATLASRYRALALLALLTVLYGWNLDQARSLTDHEVHLAATSRQMIETGHFLAPRIGEELWLEKPPAPQWLAIVSSYVCGGLTPLALRLPSALEAIALVFLTQVWVARLLGRETGWLAALALATSVFILQYARLAEADMLLLLVFTAGLTCFVGFATSQHDRNLSAWRWGFWGCAGMANLAKGLIFGNVLLAVTLIAWCIAHRNFRVLVRLWSWPGAGVALVLAAAWPLAVLSQEPSAAELWRQHLLGRAAGTLGYTEPWWYYLTTWPWQLLPWTPLVLNHIARRIRRREPLTPHEVFLLLWFVGHASLLSLSAGKHHHYLIYGLPAIAPFIAIELQALAHDMQHDARVIKWQGWLWLVVGAPAFAFAAAFVYWYQPMAFPVTSAVALSWVAITAAVVGMGLRGSQPQRALGTFCGCVLVMQILAQQWVLPQRDPSRADTEFFRQAAALTPPSAILAAYGDQEISRSLYYLQRPTAGLWHRKSVARLSEGHTAVYVITRRRRIADLQSIGTPHELLGSQRTRRERSPDDRFALYRIDRSPSQRTAEKPIGMAH